MISEIDRCLRSWSYRSEFGLPQNRDASSFLANLTLLSVDEAMLSRGYKYYRYMDDIVGFVKGATASTTAPFLQCRPSIYMMR